MSCFLSFLLLLCLIFLLSIFDVNGFRNNTAECTTKYKSIIKDTCKTQSGSSFLCFNFNTTKEYSNFTPSQIVDTISLKCCEEACILSDIISKYCCDEPSCFQICKKKMNMEKLGKIRKKKSPLFRQILSSFMI